MTEAQKERVLESMEKNKTGGWITGPDGVIEIFEDVSKAIEERIDRRIESKINETLHKMYEKTLMDHELENIFSESKFQEKPKKKIASKADFAIPDKEPESFGIIAKNCTVDGIPCKYNIENDKKTINAYWVVWIEDQLRDQKHFLKKANELIAIQAKEFDTKDKEIKLLRRVIKFDDEFTIKKTE